MLTDRTLEREIATIASDNRSGATALTERCAALLIDWVDNARDTDVEALAQLGARLIRAQPSMASIFNLVNAVLIAAEGEPVETAVREAARQFEERMGGNAGSCARSAALALRDATTIATYSASSAVFQAVAFASEANRRLTVFCSESRPAREGVQLAEALAEAGIRVTILTDAALFSAVDCCDHVLVGADAVLAAGLVNKVGTLPLALCAHRAGVPFSALAPREKWLPTAAEGWHAVTQHSADEVLPYPLAGVAVSNPYYDTTPFPLVTHVAAETGIHTAPEICRELREMKVSHWLQPRSSP